MADLDLTDIQGLILRGYTMPAVRYLFLKINDAAGARRFLGGLVSGDPASSPQLTTATPWAVKPDSCVNLGITYDGLKALGLSEATLLSFPDEFREGPVARAVSVGDTGESAPDQWAPPFGTPEVHLMISVFAVNKDALERQTATLAALFGRDGAMTEAGRRDGFELPDGRVHFGYKDGISQPTIEGGPERKIPDMQPAAPAGEFLLGYPSQFVNHSYPVPQPVELGRNGSFVVFRVLKQEVAAFEKFLRDTAPQVGLSEEKLAAKMCGRWRNGVPIVLSPDTDSPEPPLPPDQYNNFDYVNSEWNPSGFNDKKGYRCPIGSHVRRNNPRGQEVAGGDDGRKHRLIRRGMPYGPPFDPANPGDGIERGLLGMFIGVSILDQFEFLMAHWINDGIFTPGISGTKDPLMGDHTPADSKLTIPDPAGKKVVTGFPRFVTTRGGAYCFLPSVTALRYLASSAPV